MLVVSLNLETISKDDEIEMKNYLKLDRRLWNNPQETTARSLRCPNQPKKRNLCPPSGSFLTPSGRRSSRCSRSRIRPNPPDAPALMPGKPSMASSFRCERAVNGTNCLKALATTAAYTARSSGGKNEAFSIFYGPFCSPPATNSAAWTGKGSPPMAAWAKRAAFPNRQAPRILHGPQKRAVQERGGPNPTDRGKAGVQKSGLVEGNGGPLSAAISGANTPDGKLLAVPLDAVVVEGPQPSQQEQHLGLDKG